MEQLRTIGHLALHYGPGDQQGARRLLELCGCTLVDNGPSPGNDGFCSVLVDGKEVRTCVTPVASVANQEIITLEGLPARWAKGLVHRGG